MYLKNQVIDTIAISIKDGQISFYNRLDELIETHNDCMAIVINENFLRYANIKENAEYRVNLASISVITFA